MELVGVIFDRFSTVNSAEGFFTMASRNKGIRVAAYVEYLVKEFPRYRTALLVVGASRVLVVIVSASLVTSLIPKSSTTNLVINSLVVCYLCLEFIAFRTGLRQTVEFLNQLSMTEEDARRLEEKKEQLRRAESAAAAAQLAEEVAKLEAELKRKGLH